MRDRERPLGLAEFEGQGLVTAAEAEEAIARIRMSTSLDDAAAAELVIEAVTQRRARERCPRTRPPPMSA